MDLALRDDEIQMLRNKVLSDAPNIAEDQGAGNKVVVIRLIKNSLQTSIVLHHFSLFIVVCISWC